ncbi:hypothetical protein N7638_17440 [Achromobacter mucicolens]|uniref:Uncharacterized protein n=1 Tax=Achromobacter aegrifaciens TaxID=1287736 RepID=A0AAD2J4P2_ACHAE|nr:hypothetical protein [Achromobacter mucicolens]MDG9969828.1 hypothetical protein [Achromobacter mucicolens]CAB3894334.1 hypothetical protein LMG26684_04264 [Achromobacter mucicolens]CUJ70635.1 Uncharacterised protein [Achromobacter aegrifaciens]
MNAAVTGATAVADADVRLPAASRFAVLGVTDDRDFCQCCGRQGLKRVVWIEDGESGAVRHFGTTCATAPAKGFGVAPAVKAAIARYEDAQRLFWTRVNTEYRRRGGRHVPDPARRGVFVPDDPALKDAVVAELRQTSGGLPRPAGLH